MSETNEEAPARTAGGDPFALVLTGGGARAAYQVGFLRCLCRRMPHARLPILTGVSAGAINAAFLAAHPGSLCDSTEGLTDLWLSLSPEKVYKVGSVPLARNVLRWGARLLSGGARGAPAPKSLLDSSPLRAFLERCLVTVDGEVQGIDANLEDGHLKALALTTLNYGTGRTETWVHGRDVAGWERPWRLGRTTRIRVDHVMASAALPLLFPAVKIAGAWYGDGGVRLSAPLAPAIHLGARRILAISTRYGRSRAEAEQKIVPGYPPPVHVAGLLLNAIFLDAIDQDAENLERINRLLATAPPAAARGLRPIKLLVLRPSVDLGRLAAKFEARLPGAFRFFARGLGTRETSSPDFLSLLLFQRDYIEELISIGERDAEARRSEIEELMAADADAASRDPAPGAASEGC